MSTSEITVMSFLNTNFVDISTGQIPNNRDSYGALYSQNVVIYMLWQIVPPVLLVLGCFGNVMTIVVMRAMRSSESIACLSLYFTALAVSDLFLLISSVLWDVFCHTDYVIAKACKHHHPEEGHGGWQQSAQRSVPAGLTMRELVMAIAAMFRAIGCDLVAGAVVVSSPVVVRVQ
ncbi:hypothetical protein ACOMHN_020635 [Nucella lapillus]